MKHKLLLGVALAISTGVALVPGRMRLAYADYTIDCSSLKALNFDHKYQQGDHVWSSFGYTGSGYSLKCVLSECYEKNANDGTAWKTEGTCSARPPGL